MLRLITTVFLLCCLSGTAGAQQLEQSLTPAAEKLVVGIGGKIAGKKYQVSGDGTCRHTPDVAVGEASASVWTVRYQKSGEDDLEGLNLRLQRPKDGSPDQLSLSLETRKTGSHRIETGGGGKDQGEAKVAILPNGPGGRLEINGKDARGKRIQITIDCPAFAPPGPDD
jgi:hypothetical protein